MTDLRGMQQLVQACWRRSKPLAAPHVGDLAWWSRNGTDGVRIWRDAQEIVAWGWPDADDGSLEFLVDPDRPDLAREVLAAYPDVEATWALDSDAGKRLAVLEAGFRRNDGAWFELLGRGLDDLPEPAVPGGFELRSSRGFAELGARVEVHRAAFHPSRLTRPKYARVTATWPYREELDLVIEAPSGRLAAFCLAWLDEENAVGELEPVGTHPDFRRRGLARAVCLGALRALRERGAATAVVYAAGGDRGASPLYLALGFERLGRIERFQRG